MYRDLNEKDELDSRTDTMDVSDTTNDGDVEDITAVAVMGVTGSGKSNFIKHATNSERVRVGHSLQSCTEDVEKYEMLLDGRQVMLFDTPGFDDTYRLDADILAELAENFSAMYKNKLKMAGIIYVHKITDNRMTNTLLRNLSVIQNICGDEPLKNVIILTTFWDSVDANVAKTREAEMIAKHDWWGYMISKGAKTRRFFNTESSAHDILQEFMNKDRVTLQIQAEMVDQGLTIKETHAGTALNSELVHMAEQHQKDLAALETKISDARRAANVQLQEALAIERQQKEKELTRMLHEQMAMERDRNEDMRRMEQAFQDQILRMVEDRKERERQISKLETQLTEERAEAQSRLEAAIQASEENLQAITSRFDNARVEDKERFQQQMLEYQQERDSAMQKYKEEVQLANSEIIRMFEEKQGATDKERQRLEQSISQLKTRKSKSNAMLWLKIGGTALCAALAPFTHGLTTLAMPAFSALGTGGDAYYDSEDTQDYDSYSF